MIKDIDGKDFPEVDCSMCHAHVIAHYMEPTKSEMVEQQLCFSCHFWTGYVKTKHMSTHVVIEGKHYVIENDLPKGQSWPAGFGGREFKIKLANGLEIVTRNLWHQGEVPELFRDKLPNNAEFINAQSK